MAENKGAQELQNLLDTWPENQAEVKAAYISLKEHAESIEGVVWEFIAMDRRNQQPAPGCGPASRRAGAPAVLHGRRRAHGRRDGAFGVFLRRRGR